MNLTQEEIQARLHYAKQQHSNALMYQMVEVVEMLLGDACALLAASPLPPAAPAMEVLQSNFDLIEGCLPDTADTSEDGRFMVSAQWLHDFGNMLISRATAPAGQVAPQATVERRISSDESEPDFWPIAKLTIENGKIANAEFYAPSLPDGVHDVFPAPTHLDEHTAAWYGVVQALDAAAPGWQLQSGKNGIESAVSAIQQLATPPAKRGEQADKAQLFDLGPVITWLENGRDPKEAAQELRIYKEKMTPPVKFPYQETFNAIGAATTWHENGSIGISVKAFEESFNATVLPQEGEAKAATCGLCGCASPCEKYLAAAPAGLGEAKAVVPEGLADILREAAEIINLIDRNAPPSNIRWPIVDELQGFAFMLNAAAPAAQPLPVAANPDGRDADEAIDIIKAVAEQLKGMAFSVHLVREGNMDVWRFIGKGEIVAQRVRDFVAAMQQGEKQ